MLLQIKVYLISVMYLFGAMFMILYPPRNYELSGAKIRTVRSVGAQLHYTDYVDYKKMLETAERLGHNDDEVANLVYLTPRTTGNRSIVALELHSDKLSKKPGILIIGALNSMAWGATNAILELAEKLLYDSNYQTPFFNDYDWYLIPLANPDGVHFTKSLRSFRPVDTKQWSWNVTARINTRPQLWHKNIDNEEDDVCFGTNVNRNFAYHWQDDVRKTPEHCSQYYPGAKPFSTAEAQAIRTYIHQVGDFIHLAIHLHANFVPKKEAKVFIISKSVEDSKQVVLEESGTPRLELIVYPWRYTKRQQSNYRTLQAIGEYAARNARLPDGRLYEVHQSSNDELVAGSLSDYISGVVGTDLVYLIKPYHQPFPNYTDSSALDIYIRKAITTILSLVRGWRSSTKQNTLSFFGTDIEF